MKISIANRFSIGHSAIELTMCFMVGPHVGEAGGRRGGRCGLQHGGEVADQVGLVAGVACPFEERPKALFEAGVAHCDRGEAASSLQG